MYKSLRIQPETHANVKLLSGMMSINMDMVIRVLTTMELTRRYNGLKDVEKRLDELIIQLRKEAVI